MADKILSLTPFYQHLAILASRGDLVTYATGLRAKLESTRWYEPIRRFHLERQLIVCQFAIECFEIGMSVGSRSSNRV